MRACVCRLSGDRQTERETVEVLRRSYVYISKAEHGLGTVFISVICAPCNSKCVSWQRATVSAWGKEGRRAVDRKENKEPVSLFFPPRSALFFM